MSTYTPALLVPMAVEGLVVSAAARSGSWSWTPPRYGFLPWFESTDPAPFTPQPPLPGAPGFTGAVLHWSLPDGLTQGGAADDDGVVTYPAVPNRWLVVRRHRDPAHPDRWAYFCALVASDQRGDATGAPFPGPHGDGQLHVGRWWPLAEFPGEAALGPSPLPGPLTAVGPGDATFAAFTPNVPLVLSFADPLTGVDAGPVTYGVYGWYADPGQDPLDGWRTVADWHASLARLGWAVDDLDHAVAAGRRWAADHGRTTDPHDPRTLYPARTICHGTLADVAWLGVDGPRFTGVPTSNPQRSTYRRPRIALGNTVISATAALLGPDALRGITAEPGPEEQGTWFGATPGGTRWEVVAPPEPDRPDGGPGPVPLDPDQAAALTALNTAQRELDRVTARLDALRADREALRWKHDYLAHHPALRERWAAAVAAAARHTDALLTEAGAEAAWWAERRDRARAGLRARLGHLLLTEVDGAPALHPNDPVVVIAGARRSFRHGADGLHTDDATLLCRFSGQTFAGIDVATAHGEVHVPGHRLPRPRLDVAGVPAEAQDLATETDLLDSGCAPAIAALADPGDPWPLLPGIRHAQTVIWNAALHPAVGPAAAAAATRLRTLYGLGALPSVVSFRLWESPWSPLYLDWKVRFHPAADRDGDELRDWAPPAGDDETGPDDWRYAWRGRDERRPGLVFTGRTLLTPQAGEVLAGAVERLTGFAPGARALAADLRRADLLSQSLSGLGPLLLQRGTDTVRGPAAPGRWAPQWRPLAGALARQFQPLRAGHLQIVDLRVVDDFGQVFRVMDAAPAPLVCDPDLTGDVPGLAVLRPRITQPARLELALLDAADDRCEVGVDTGADPLCGFLLGQPLDRAVAVYDAAGTMLGQLMLSLQGAWWWPAPQDGVPADRIGNAHLRGLVAGILGRPDPAAAVRDLLRLMADAAWADDRGDPAWSDAELPIPVGQPVAVARLAVRWRLPGGPATAQRWAGTGRADTGGFERLRPPVRLGSTELPADGVVGWYTGDDYRHVDSPFAPARPDPGGYVARRPVRAALDEPAGAAVTALVAPHAAVHAISGLLPPVAVALPGARVTPALRRMAVTVRTGPVLDDGGGPAFPLAATSGEWSWLQLARPGRLLEQPIAAADDTARLPGAPVTAREGWLRLVPADRRTRLTYTVTPRAVACTADPRHPSYATVRLTAYNGSGADVTGLGLVLTLPVGTGPDDLTGDPDDLVVDAPDWHVDELAAGVYRCRPRTPEPIAAGQSTTLTVRAIRVNPWPAMCAVRIDEHTDRPRSTTCVVSTLDTMEAPEG
ncbi:hypothetical protein [Dactylosporangium sp. NPDC051541]|uniref:hypothetical protein n=1 Tax=Dactylosporangium sp. NPDC051541 TaxID=3363977 RepID=UPI0037903710